MDIGRLGDGARRAVPLNGYSLEALRFSSKNIAFTTDKRIQDSLIAEHMPPFTKSTLAHVQFRIYHSNVFHLAPVQFEQGPSG